MHEASWPRGKWLRPSWSRKDFLPVCGNVLVGISLVFSRLVPFCAVLLGPLGGRSGASVGSLGGFWGAWLSPPAASPAASGPLGRSWSAPGRSGAVPGSLLGASWAGLGGSWAALGPILGRSWPLLARSWGLLGVSWGLLGCSWQRKLDFHANLEKHCKNAVRLGLRGPKLAPSWA